MELTGHLGKDPEYKELDGDKYRATFSVATTERYKKDGDWHDGHTEWFNIVAWGKQAQAASRLRKGDCVYMVGKFKTRDWTDNEGVKRYITEFKPHTLYKIAYEKRQQGAPPPADEYDVGDLGPPLDMDAPLTPGD
jgi:single-strand DNA-binding protein